jgi:hypothetical protein
MGVRIINDPSDRNDYACLYDSVSMTAFGPVFDDAEEADDFLEWYDKNGPRSKVNNTEVLDLRIPSDSELETLVKEFRDAREAD